MGIREHLSKEIDEKDMKLSDLEFDQKETEKLEFDVEQEVTDEDWKIMLDDLEYERSQERSQGNYHLFLFDAMKCKLLFPDRVNQLELDDDNVQNFVENELKDPFKNGNILHYVSYMAEAKSLYPDIFDRVKLRQKDMDRIKQEFNQYFEQETGASRRHFLTSAEFMQLKIWLPRIFDELDKNVLKKLKGNSLKVMEQEKDGFVRGCFVKEAAFFRVLFPEDFEKLEIDDDLWKEMHRILRTERRIGDKSEKRKGRNEFSTIAWAMKILAAKEVKITDEGLELVMEEEDFKQEKKKRPERKSF